MKMEHTLRVFKNRLMRKIFGYKREGMRGHWRRLHYMELHSLHSIPIYFQKDKIRKNKIGSAFGTCGGGGEVHTELGKEI